MQFYGEDWCEIDGKIIEDLGSFCTGTIFESK